MNETREDRQRNVDIANKLASLDGYSEDADKEFFQPYIDGKVTLDDLLVQLKQEAMSTK